MSQAAVQSREFRTREPQPASRELRRALRYRAVELSLLAVTVSGLMLWELLGLPWSWVGPVLLLHVAGGTLLVAAVIAPFWLEHRRRLQLSRQAAMRRTGRLIEIALGLLAASGVYLFLIGNRGELGGRIAQQIHLWLAFPLAAGVALHLARGRLRARRAPARAERPGA